MMQCVMHMAELRSFGGRDYVMEEAIAAGAVHTWRRATQRHRLIGAVFVVAAGAGDDG